MYFLNNPKWLDYSLAKYKNFDDIPQEVFDKINIRLDKIISSNPEVTIVITAWNEEINIIRCIASLSLSETHIPFDIIVVNNNSTDKTQQSLNKLNVKSLFQKEQGCGISRQLGQEKALGKYILSADADCYYSKKWIQLMANSLQKPNVVAVYSKHSFLGNQKVPRWNYSLYEFFKDLMIEFRNYKRPYLNAYGMSLGYVKELGLKEGYDTRNMRGEDGRLCFDLMKYGKIKLVRASSARVWTSDRVLQRDGSLWHSVYKRILKEIFHLKDYFTTPEPHDTKTSENRELTPKEYEEHRN